MTNWRARVSHCQSIIQKKGYTFALANQKNINIHEQQ